MTTPAVQRAVDAAFREERGCIVATLIRRTGDALTLRSLAGLSTAEIARAFLVPEATMAKCLTLAKATIAAAGIPYRVPPAQRHRPGGVPSETAAGPVREARCQRRALLIPGGIIGLWL